MIRFHYFGRPWAFGSVRCRTGRWFDVGPFALFLGWWW